MSVGITSFVIFVNPIAYLAESKGGTAYTVDYAEKNGLTVFNIAELL